MAKGKYQEWLTEDGLIKIEGMARDYKVYMHVFPNGKKYIGITCQSPNDRWRRGKGYKANPYLMNAFAKYKWENVSSEILFDGLTKEEAEKKEIALIKKHKSTNKNYGYNLEEGGSSPGPTNKDVRKRISKAKKGKGMGKDNPFYGKTHTKEVREKLSIIATGRKHSEETLERIANSNKKEVVQLCKNGEFIKRWESAKDAGESLKIHNTSITAVCRGRRLTAGGYTWRYVGDYCG